MSNRYDPAKIRGGKSHRSGSREQHSYLGASGYHSKAPVIPFRIPTEKPTKAAKAEVHRLLRKVKLQIKELQKKQKEQGLKIKKEAPAPEKRTLDLTSPPQDPYQAWFNLNAEERIRSVRVVSRGTEPGQFRLTLDPEEEEDLYFSDLSPTPFYSIDHFQPSISSWFRDQVVEVRTSGREVCHLSFEIEKIPSFEWIEFSFT